MPVACFMSPSRQQNTEPAVSLVIVLWALVANFVVYFIVFVTAVRVTMFSVFIG
jgi:hypothetical protein